MTKNHADARSAGREEKIEEILAILGDLYHRFGLHQSAPTNIGMATPDYKFVGYRPYAQGQTMPTPVQWPVGYAAPAMGRASTFVPF